MSWLESGANKVIAIGGACAVLAAGIAYFGFAVTTPQDQIVRLEVKLDKLQGAMDVQGEEIATLRILQEATLRADCLEHPRADLVKLGLAKKCEELGVTP